VLAGAVLLLVVGCSNPSEPPVEKPSEPPVEKELFVDVEAEPDEGAPPLTVRFTATVEDNEGPVECEWDFGDGSPKEAGLRPTHVYGKVSDYEIVTRCKDAAGTGGEGDTDVFVEAAP